MGYIVAKFGGWANASAENVKLAADLFERISKTACKLNNNECTEEEIKENKEIRNKKVHINKVPKTTEEKLEYKPRIKKEEENKEIAEELEELFEEEFEYDDD